MVYVILWMVILSAYVLRIIQAKAVKKIEDFAPPNFNAFGIALVWT
jgi:hypothetical protein